IALIELKRNVKYHLKDGIPCKAHSCIKCCIKTKMILSKEDIERIKKVGYEEKSFLYRKGSIFMIKNKNGKCVFLKDFGCSIYKYRPLGCKLYPLIYDTKKGFIIDNLCPYRNEFKISKNDVKELSRLINKIFSIDDARPSFQAFL
ncbi:MAG: YkgJ family cysteine cluster protein, partial [Candidatus Bathyarchaeia archaeon]